jgi:aspartate racemase
MKKIETIGIVGGVGPYAGLDLNRKIFDHTNASSDQDHLPVLLGSLSHLIGDRTRYLLDNDIKNPSENIFKVIRLLANAGATVIGIPCNTAHADEILSDVERRIADAGLDIKLLNMVREVGQFVSKTYGPGTQVGVLSTLGTHKTGLYRKLLKKEGIQIINPEDDLVDSVHYAIYDPEIGIKSKSNPVTEEAQKIVKKAVYQLGDQGASAVILGCTELPIAIPETVLDKIFLIDPATILARALIREVAPEKLIHISSIS